MPLPPLAVPPQTGRTVIVTGSNTGLGYATARALGAAGADVTLAVRNREKGLDALARLAVHAPAGRYQVMDLDLASQSSVHRFVDRWAGRALDVLVNNAGMNGTRRRRLTENGFELTLASNYLGHFALTSLLLPSLRETPAPRVVNLGSLMARQGRDDLADPHLSDGYSPGRAYSNAKLATIAFAVELDRRSARGGWGVAALAAHPGWSRTDIFGGGRLVRLGNEVGRRAHLSQPPEEGAQPIVFAATSPDALSGGYYGPLGPGGLVGRPGPVQAPRLALDADYGRRLWELSAELTQTG